MDYKNSRQSQNVQLDPTMTSNDPIGALLQNVQKGPQHYMFPGDNNYVSGMPLSGDQVQAFAERMPSYVDPEQARIRALIQQLGKR